MCVNWFSALVLLGLHRESAPSKLLPQLDRLSVQERLIGEQNPTRSTTRWQHNSPMAAMA